MVGRRLNVFACLLFPLLSLYVNHALARVSNITFSGAPALCKAVTISWEGGTPPFEVNVLQVDLLAQPGPDGIIPGNTVQAVDTGNARRVLWTANAEPGDVLVAVVRDGLNQNATSSRRVVQTSTDTACLEDVVCRFGLIWPGRSDNENQQSSNNTSLDIVLPTLSVRPVGTSTTATGSQTIFISAATESHSEAPPVNQ